jgi:chromosome segregation protein
VFLKSLTLKGFKSFADATSLHLEPGVTVVVGPNGSGKSNVVDAIAWVLGAQAPSAVRSQKMDDVIFAGTTRRPALGRAEVSLTIDNSRGILPIEFTEVTVARTLFRTGESEYAINGAPCRLLDIQELLSDAGVGRQQHVIVGQGQIDGVLNARPEDRRAIIEEAAGVLKYRKRKEKAERRLDATEGNLLRVQDLLREVRRQLRPLERQAEAARRHGELIGELTSLRVFLAGREIAGLRVRLQAFAGERAAAEEADRRLRAELASLDTAVVAAEAELAARGDTDVSDALVRVEQLRERARGVLGVIAERRRSMERDRGQLMDAGVVANLEADAARLRDELVSVSADLAAMAPAAEALAAEETRFAAEREGVLATLGDAPTTRAAASAAAEVRGELRTLRAGLERSDADRHRSHDRLANLHDRLARLDADIDRLRSEYGQLEGQEVPLVDQLEQAETRRAEAVAAVDHAAAVHQAAGAELARWQARAEALGQALDSARARAGAERLAGLEGVLGTLLEVVDVDAGWEAAFEAAAGDALLAVVVDGHGSARDALVRLSEAAASGAVLAAGGQAGGLPDAPVGEPVRRHVRATDPRVDPLLDRLLATAVRVDGGWEDAATAALVHPELTVVTATGDRFGLTGWRLGAASGGATAAALDEAVARLAEATAEVDRTAEALRRAEAACAAALAQERELTTRLDAHDARHTAAAEALTRRMGERQETANEAERLAGTLAELDDHLHRQRERDAELAALLPSLEQDEAAEAEAARHRGAVRAELERRAAALASRRKDLEVRNAGLHERQRFLERRLAETERRLETDTDARAVAATRRERIERDLSALQRLSALVEGHRQVIDVELEVLHDQRRRQSDEVRAITQRLDDVRRRRAAAEKDLDEARERGRRVELDQAEARLRLEAAVEALRRDLDVEPERAESAEPPVLPEGTTAAARVRELEGELRLLGPINPLALEEFNALQERHAFLEEQLEDVKRTRRDLARVIRGVDAEIEATFGVAFADVSRNFTALFGTLFPGGSGQLVLTAPDDLLNTGIEVEAKPSGKNVKKLSLLSGGERSLTALAFLFAVFRSRPSPFYVMDEVEAALDDVNLHRFLGLVQEFRNDAQLLIVSHQKRTMEAADALLGVTMQPGGSSKVVVERAGSSA